MLLRHSISLGQDGLLRVLFVSQLPFQFARVVLDKMGLSALYSDEYFQELNQDDYYTHRADIASKHHFHLRFWQNVFYFLELGELRMIYNNNSIRILATLMEGLEPIISQLPEFPLFYLLLSFLAGKNLATLITQMALPEGGAIRLKDALTTFVETHLQKSQFEMGQFVFDLLQKVSFGLPKKEEIFNEEFSLEENQYNLKIYLESQIRIYQYNFHNLVPQNIYS